MKFETLTIHKGNQITDKNCPVVQPITLSTTFEHGNEGGALYTRASNPNRSSLEEVLAAMEKGVDAAAFSSGNAAGTAVYQALEPGSHIVAPDDMYHGLHNSMVQLFAGVLEVTFVDMSDLDAVKNAIRPNTKLFWVESPSNPLLKITDIRAIAQLSKAQGAIMACDNTFATPVFQNPLDLGADIVMHSATKYLGGHSDVIAGALIIKDKALGEELHFKQFATGATLGPMDSFLVLRGIKTLHLRVQRHCENGEKVAAYLDNHPLVERVYYPGLASHPFHEIAKKQMSGFGGMVTFTFKSGKKEDAIKFLENLKVFTLAESLGGVESLANHPALMTHASIPEDKRKEVGISDDLVRLSVGIEDIEDLLADLEQAFK